MMTHRNRTTLVGIVSSLLVLTACASQPPAETTTQPASPIATSPTAKDEKTTEKSADPSDAKKEAAETMDPKAGFAGMKDVVAKTTTAVMAGDFAKAATSFDQFETYWSKVEDGFKAKSADGYKAIEEEMDNVKIGLKSADKAKTLAALQTLGKVLTTYAGKL